MNAFSLLSARAAAVKYAAEVTGVREFETGLGVPQGGAAAQPLSAADQAMMKSMPPEVQPKIRGHASGVITGGRSPVAALLKSLRGKVGTGGLGGLIGTAGVGLGLGIGSRVRPPAPPELPAQNMAEATTPTPEIPKATPQAWKDILKTKGN